MTKRWKRIKVDKASRDLMKNVKPEVGWPYCVALDRKVGVQCKNFPDWIQLTFQACELLHAKVVKSQKWSFVFENKM